MTRLFAIAATALWATAFGAPDAQAETEADRNARCAGQALIVARAVDLRASGADQPGATAQLEASDSGIDPKYAPSVAVLVGWIYTLPTDQLTAETARAFQTQCQGFKP